ncbi:MAG: SCO family protein [Chromatiales bacterium]|nr:SCO family protein [Chromatiales bacterium]MDX9766521.1 SCO family protein [Ectothiorhodospiraceae bacterium]
MPNNRKHFILIVLAGIVALGLGLWVGTLDRGDRPASGIPALPPTALAAGEPMPAFELIDGDGERFDNARLAGHWTYLYIGYTYCPDICPMTLGLLGAVMDELKQAGVERMPQVVFVSVDPERDTVEQLKTYVGYFNPDFIGTTGDPSAIAVFAKKLGLFYNRVDDPRDPANYLIDHSATILLIDPAGRLHARIEPPHQIEAMARQYREIAGGDTRGDKAG